LRGLPPCDPPEFRGGSGPIAPIIAPTAHRTHKNKGHGGYLQQLTGLQRALFKGLRDTCETLQNCPGFFCFIYRFRVPHSRRYPAGFLPISAAPAGAD